MYGGDFMSKAVNLIKSNIFLFVVIVAYGILTVLSPSLGKASILNSGYYIKEMLMIMPVIFVLTALLDTWIPKDTITKFLGKEAKGKGVLFAFLLGSISAGPIYAAFPICTTLHKKGASIQNIVIILSSWAVVKIPMLINEAKFLGIKFMVIRWIFTIIAILIFSYLTAKFVKDEDIPQKIETQKRGLYINTDVCMGCTICTKKYSEVFEMSGKKACLKQDTTLDIEKLNQAINSCPVKAIDYLE